LDALALSAADHRHQEPALKIAARFELAANHEKRYHDIKGLGVA
jgi:hypothetical protein